MSFKAPIVPTKGELHAEAQRHAEQQQQLVAIGQRRNRTAAVAVTALTCTDGIQWNYGEMRKCKRSSRPIHESFSIDWWK